MRDAGQGVRVKGDSWTLEAVYSHTYLSVIKRGDRGREGRGVRSDR